MDIEKLIEQLKNLEACAYGYHINGEVLGMNCSDFEQVMVDAADEIANVPTLRAENKRLKSLLGESGQDLWSKENQRADRLEAENKKLRAELEQVKRERDEAVHDRMMMEQSVGELSARAESAEADNKKLCAAMMQLKRTDRPNRMSVIYELEYDSSMSHKTMEEVAFIVFKGLMDADLKLRGPKEV